MAPNSLRPAMCLFARPVRDNRNWSDDLPQAHHIVVVPTRRRGLMRSPRRAPGRREGSKREAAFAVIPRIVPLRSEFSLTADDAIRLMGNN